MAAELIRRIYRGSAMNPEESLPRLLKGPQVASSLGVARSKAYQMMADGTLPIVRMGRSVRVPEQALREWVEQHTQNRGGGYWRG